MDAIRDQTQNLERALDSNREIAVAIGVLMTTHRIIRADAFNLLRTTSQRSNRKMSDIATEVADTGVPLLEAVAFPTPSSTSSSVVTGTT